MVAYVSKDSRLERGAFYFAEQIFDETCPLKDLFLFLFQDALSFSRCTC